MFYFYTFCPTPLQKSVDIYSLNRNIQKCLCNIFCSEKSPNSNRKKKVKKWEGIMPLLLYKIRKIQRPKELFFFSKKFSRILLWNNFSFKNFILIYFLYSFLILSFSLGASFRAFPVSEIATVNSFPLLVKTFSQKQFLGASSHVFRFLHSWEEAFALEQGV